MKKWVIGGMIIGAAWPIFALLSPPYAPLPFGSVGLALTLFPFGILMMDISLESTPHFFWQVYTIASILNIGLYTLLGYIVGRIVQGIKCK